MNACHLELLRKEFALIRVHQLKKSYGEGFSLQANDFHLRPGEIVAFLGANGAGKTTLFDLLTANSDPTEGEIWWDNERLIPENFLLKRQIGYLPQTMPLPKWVTGQELLHYSALLHELSNPKECVQHAMEFWDCHSYRNRPLAACSFGMQKRIGLALATLHKPPFLILDEPFSGLDIFHIHALEHAIQERRSLGQTTVLSTHILPYVVESCERVFILSAGQVLEIANWTTKADDEKKQTIEQYFFQRGKPPWHQQSVK